MWVRWDLRVVVPDPGTQYPILQRGWFRNRCGPPVTSCCHTELGIVCVCARLMYILLLTVAQAKVQELLAEQSTNNTPAGRRAQLINRGRVGQVARGGSAMESRCKESLASAGRKAGSLCASWIKYGRAVRFPPSPGALGEGRGAGFIKREGKTRTATVKREREKEKPCPHRWKMDAEGNVGDLEGVCRSHLQSCPCQHMADMVLLPSIGCARCISSLYLALPLSWWPPGLGSSAGSHCALSSKLQCVGKDGASPGFLSGALMSLVRGEKKGLGYPMSEYACIRSITM